MAAFGLDIASVLLLIAVAARSTLARWRGRMMSAGGRGKAVPGAMPLLIGIAILTGYDRRFEAFALDHLPDRVTDLSTRV